LALECSRIKLAKALTGFLDDRAMGVNNECSRTMFLYREIKA
jgi:hypothetical protein